MNIKKTLPIAVILGATFGLSACAAEPDEASCRDIQKLERALAPVQVEKNEAKDEIVDDLREVGQDNNCPGYDDGDED